MLDRASGARIVFYLAAGFGVWLWLSSIRIEGGRDVGEERDILNARTALKVGDSLRATRARAKTLAGSLALKGNALLASGTQLRGEIAEADSALQRAKDMADTNRQLQRANIKLRLYATQMRDAALFFNEARVIDSTRADQAETALGTMTDHTMTLMRRLEARRSFTVGFIKIPRPAKWQAGLIGCTLGASLDTRDRLRGCAAGGLGTVLLVPTR